LVGSCASANDVAATDAVVASEITRLRMKEGENTIMLPPKIRAIARGDIHGPALAFPGFVFFSAHPKTQTLRCQFRNDGVRTSRSQLKSDL
jgi:hypothetical protein